MRQHDISASRIGPADPALHAGADDVSRMARRGPSVCGYWLAHQRQPWLSNRARLVLTKRDAGDFSRRLSRSRATSIDPNGNVEDVVLGNPPADGAAWHRASLRLGVGDAARTEDFASPTPDRRLDLQLQSLDQ
jgi:hypothetical protein